MRTTMLAMTTPMTTSAIMITNARMLRAAGAASGPMMSNNEYPISGNLLFRFQYIQRQQKTHCRRDHEDENVYGETAAPDEPGDDGTHEQRDRCYPECRARRDFYYRDDHSERDRGRHAEERDADQRYYHHPVSQDQKGQGADYADEGRPAYAYPVGQYPAQSFAGSHEYVKKDGLDKGLLPCHRYPVSYVGPDRDDEECRKRHDDGIPAGDDMIKARASVSLLRVVFVELLARDHQRHHARADERYPPE